MLHPGGRDVIEAGDAPSVRRSEAFDRATRLWRTSPQIATRRPASVPPAAKLGTYEVVFERRGAIEGSDEPTVEVKDRRTGDRVDVALDEVVGRSHTVDPDGTLVRTARALGICLGDSA